MFEIVETSCTDKAKIKVIGVGGGGGNAVEHMIANTIEGVEFVCANTDAQALAKSSVPVPLQLGTNLTKGLGAGADPELGRAAAIEDRDRIAEILDGTDMLFITAGMGGGTGTGASPVIAEIAGGLGVLTVAVVTRPFKFELGRRMTIANDGIDELSKQVDSLIVVPNERLISVLGRGVTLKAAFAAANDVLLGAVQGISELIVRPGLVNVDFADVRAVMTEKGRAMMGAGKATGQDRAFEAAKKATTCPLLENVDLRGARGILVNITADPNLGMDEYAAVGEVVEDFAAPGANVITGTVIDENAGEELRIIVVATGLGLGAATAPVASGSNVAVLPVPGAGGEPDPVEVPPPPGREMGADRDAGQRRYIDPPSFFERDGVAPVAKPDGQRNNLDVPPRLRNRAHDAPRV